MSSVSVLWLSYVTILATARNKMLLNAIKTAPLSETVTAKSHCRWHGCKSQGTVDVRFTLCNFAGGSSQGSADQFMKKPIRLSLILDILDLNTFDAWCVYHLLVQHIPSICHFVRKNTQQSFARRLFVQFRLHECTLGSFLLLSSITVNKYW